jgi:hypothetical protein
MRVAWLLTKKEMGVLGVHFFSSLTRFLLSLKRLEKKPQADKSSSSCSTISKEELRVIDLTAHMLYVHAKKGDIFDS